MQDSDLISKKALLENIHRNTEVLKDDILGVDYKTIHDLEGIIKDAPTIDAAPVVWKPITGFEGKYEISTLGQVRNKMGMVLKQGIKRTNGTCYNVVGLCKDGKCFTKYIHRLVAEAFIPNPNHLPLINHKDEDGTNNLIDNLEWCTPQYNTTYRDAHIKRGKKLRGILHTEEHKNKISDGLRAYYATHESQSKGRVSENKKAVVLRNESTGKFLHFDSVREADLYLGGGCRANITRAIRTKGKVRGYYADWFCADGERANASHLRPGLLRDWRRGR